MQYCTAVICYICTYRVPIAYICVLLCWRLNCWGTATHCRTSISLFLGRCLDHFSSSKHWVLSRTVNTGFATFWQLLQLPKQHTRLIINDRHTNCYKLVSYLQPTASDSFAGCCIVLRASSGIIERLWYAMSSETEAMTESSEVMISLWLSQVSYTKLLYCSTWALVLNKCCAEAG